MKKFLISTFLCAACLSFCADAKGMELNVEQLQFLNERQRNLLKYVYQNDIHKLSQIIKECELEKDNYCVPSKEQIQQILDKAKNQNFDQLNDMLKKKYPQMVLIQAIENNNYELIQRLMQTEFEQTIDVNDPDEHGVTPLMHALKNGDMKIIRYLVDKCGARFLHNGTPFIDKKGVHIQYYARLGDQKTSNQGVELYAKMRIHNELQRMQKALQDQYDKIRQIEIRAVKQAIASGNVEVAKQAILKYNYVNQADEYGITPLMYAAQSGNYEMVLLLEMLVGLPDTKVDNNGKTLLHYAIQGGVDMVKALWVDGYITNEELSSPYDESGVVLLVSACRDGNVELVKFLSDVVEDFNNINDHIQAFKYAVRSGRATEIVPLLRELFKRLNISESDVQDLI